MMIDYYQPKLDLTLLGCGFLGPYHVGAICLLEQIWPQKPYNRICGSSVGGLVGVFLLCGLKSDYVIEMALNMLRQFRAHLKRVFAPFSWLSALGSSASSDLARHQAPDKIAGAKETVGRSRGTNGRPTDSVQLQTQTQAHHQVDKKVIVDNEEGSSSGNSLCLLPIAKLVEHALVRMLPHDAHLRCSNRLGLSVTKMSWPLENKFVSQFHTRLDLIQAVRAGCFIPFWSGGWLGPKFRGEHYMDGAYSDNEPKFPSDKLEAEESTGSCNTQLIAQVPNKQIDGDTNQRINRECILGKSVKQVTLSPFSCDVDIGPRDLDIITLFSGRCSSNIYKANWRNLVRAAHAMLPFGLETYQQYLISGHEEMKDYLFRNNLLKCRRCFERLQMEEDQTCSANLADDKPDEKSSCIYCLKLLEQVDSLRLRDEMLRLFVD